MSKIIRLEMDTGNGNVAIAFTSAGYSDNYDLLISTILSFTLDSFEKRGASDIVRDCDSAVDNLRNSRGSFTGLTPVEQSARIPAMDWFTKLRDACREHPSTIAHIIP